MPIKVIIFQKTSDDDYKNRVLGYNYPAGTTTQVIQAYDTSTTSTDPTLLKDALDTTAGVFNLIIYDWSMTLNNSNLSTYLTYLVGLTTWDVAYLGKWSDTCSKYTTVDTNATLAPYTLVGGTDPIGFNAVLLNPTLSADLKNKLSGTKIYNSINYAIQEINIDKEVKYVAFSPNLFVYDPMYNAVDNSVTYFIKTQECVSFNSQVTPPSDNALTIFWILLIILGVCVILWLLLSSRGFGLGKMEVAKSGEMT